jgi:hypothetical protein
MKDNDSPSAHIDHTLQCVLSQLSEETGMSFTIIHPGSLTSEELESAFDGLDRQHIELLKEGRPVLTSENNDILTGIERRIVRSVFSVLDPAKEAWAAFFDPDGSHAYANASSSESCA